MFARKRRLKSFYLLAALAAGVRNQYCHGDMTAVATNAVPDSQDGNRFPLISIYAFHEVNASGVDQADIVVLSRDLNNQTPVKLPLQVRRRFTP